MFRSIDERSVAFRRAPDKASAAAMGLLSVKGRLVDKGICHAMVAKIRAAQRFVYVEN